MECFIGFFACNLATACLTISLITCNCQARNLNLKVPSKLVRNASNIFKPASTKKIDANLHSLTISVFFTSSCCSLKICAPLFPRSILLRHLVSSTNSYFHKAYELEVVMKKS